MLGDLNLENISKYDEINFVEKIYPVYKAINIVSKDELTKTKVQSVSLDHGLY